MPELFISQGAPADFDVDRARLLDELIGREPYQPDTSWITDPERGHWKDTPVLLGQRGVDAYFATVGTSYSEDAERERPWELRAKQVSDRKQAAVDRLLNAFDLDAYNETCTCGVAEHNRLVASGEREGRFRSHEGCAARGNPYQLEDGFISVDDVYALVIVAVDNLIRVVKAEKLYLTGRQYFERTGQRRRLKGSQRCLYLRAESWIGPWSLKRSEFIDHAYQAAYEWRKELATSWEIEDDLDEPKAERLGGWAPLIDWRSLDRMGSIESFGDRQARRRARLGAGPDE